MPRVKTRFSFCFSSKHVNGRFHCSGFATTALTPEKQRHIFKTLVLNFPRYEVRNQFARLELLHLRVPFIFCVLKPAADTRQSSTYVCNRIGSDGDRFKYTYFAIYITKSRRGTLITPMLQAGACRTRVRSVRPHPPVKICAPRDTVSVMHNRRSIVYNRIATASCGVSAKLTSRRSEA